MKKRFSTATPHFFQPPEGSPWSTSAGAPAADKSTAAPGPLQAFGQVHRALRDSEKYQSINHEVKESQANLSKTTRRLQADVKRLGRTFAAASRPEELVLQVYEEHEQAIERERDAAAKAKAEPRPSRSPIAQLRRAARPD